MKNRLFQILLLVIILGSIWISSHREVLGLTYSSTNNYYDTYTFDVYSGHRRLSHKLYVSTPPSLCDYYRGRTHRISSEYDYAKFVTPSAFKSIAENIQNETRKMSNSDEQFTNAVLMLVHQVQYARSNVKYPVETLIDNSGDCEALSLLAASIMKSGGLDVVLFYYKDLKPRHMNVGVYLPYTPVYHTWWRALTYYEYNGKKYWMAECTPLADWKVGDQPDSFADAKPRIISLENCEKSSPAQVSSNLGTPLLSSSITVSPSQAPPSNIEENTRALTISGSISPIYSGKSVAVYVSCNGSSYDYFKTVTDSVGTYMSTWNFTSAGTYYIRTSWSGASDYAGADSETLTVFVGPESFVQFETPNYNYIFGQAATAAYALRPMEGFDHFLSIPLGTGISFSYDFIILQAGTVPNIQKETITIPGSELTMRAGRSRQTMTIQIPEKKITAPINVPTGMVPLRLSDDFNQTINNQFCFILQNGSGNNYSLNVRGLDDYDMSDIIQDNRSNSAFMNTTENIKENTWYKVTASIFENGITANLSNTYDTLIESVVIPYDAMNSNGMVMLITNNVDRAIVFKDLKIETLSSTTQPPENNKKATNDSRLLVPYVSLSILLIATFAATIVVYVKKKRQNTRK